MSVKLSLFSFLLLGVLTQTAISQMSEMDMLFQQLKYATDETTARNYEDKIWQNWFRSGDDAIDALMREAMRERNSYNFEAALKVLNQVIERRPDYAEAWNQRATIYFHMTEYEKSLQDIATTLELEPRHFGAMAGRTIIRLRQFKPALARQNMIEALKIHPYLPEKSLFPDLQ